MAEIKWHDSAREHLRKILSANTYPDSGGCRMKLKFKNNINQFFCLTFKILMLMKNNYQSKAVPRGTRTIWRYLSALILLFSLSIGQMWAAVYKTYALSDLTYTAATLTYEVTGLSGNDQKLNKGERKVEVPCASASGTLYLSGTGANASRYASIWGSNGMAVDASRKISMTSGYGSGISFTSADILTEGGKYYIVFSNVDGADYKINAFKYVLSSACGGGGSVAVTSVTIDNVANEDEFYVGDIVTFETTVEPSNATNKTLSWEVDDPSMGTITDAGVLTITAAGDFSVTATATDGSGVSASVHLLVYAAPEVCPAGLSISGTAAYTEGETISLSASLAAGNGDITYNWYKGADFATAKASGSIGTGASFSKVSCGTGDAGYYWCEASKEGCAEPVHNGTEFVVSVDPLSYCAELYPATSGASPTAANQEIILQTEAPNASFGGKIYTHSAKSGDFAASFTYTANGIQLNKGGDDKMRVELTHLMQVGTKITVTLVNPDASKARGFKLCNASGTAKATWQETTTDPYQKTYTVVAGDGLAGSNIFILQRAESSALKDLKVSNCGDELLDLNSAVDPVGEATVTLSATKVAAGGSATATYSIADPTAYDFDEWVISSGDATIANAHAAEAAITMGTTASVITLKLKAASIKHTVTYYDGETELGTELVVEGENPTATGIAAPKKIGYTFAGWSMTNGGDATALSGITVSADMPLYAVYNAVNCNALSGKIFEVNINVAPAANCTIRSGSSYETSADLIKYGTVSGGIAIAENSSTSNHLIITTTPTVKFAGGNGYVHISFDCALKVGDKIKTTIASQNIAYTTTSSRSTTNYFTKGTDQELTITSGHALENATEIYLWAASSNGGELTSLQVIRPEKFEVTFNMHDHGDAVDPQSVVEGGKVTKPADPTASGWDFGGWFTDDTYGTTWDFENMTISAATEIHALWTVHTTSSDATLSSLTVNGVAITLEDGVFGYAFELPMGTTALPTIVAVANDPNSKGVSVLQTNIGSATITVTAEDDSFKVYTISFTVATSKDIELVWDKSKKRCDDTTPAANVKSDDPSVSAYINKMTFTGGGEGSSLNVGNTAGNMVTLTAKPGYAISAMSFFGKIEADDAKLEYSLNGGAWTDLASTNAGDACYADVFTAAEVHELRMRSAGNKGFWIRNMQLTIIEACTPIVVAWDEEPVEFEVGKAGYAIAATANNGGTISYASADNTIIDANASTGALTIAGLGSVALSASTPEGDGTTYCANGGDPIVLSKTVNTYYLVTFDGQNGEAADEVKYFSGDAAIDQPTDPSFPGHTFQGWFDAASAGNPVVFPLTPSASRTIYAQWTADCAGATITTQPEGTSYLTGRTATALVCEATAGAGGALTYEWFTCDDAMRTNPVAVTATPSTAVAGTFYYFCKVMEAGCDVEAFSDVVTITVADKDPICLAWVDVTGQNAASLNAGKSLYAPEVSAAGIKNSSTYDEKTGWKFNSSPAYIAIESAPFKSGDIVEMFVTTTTTDKARVFNANEAIAANIIAEGAANMVQGANRVALTADANNLYLRRADDFGGWNPYVAYVAVYRACAPILNKVTVAGVEGAPDNTNHVAIEVPASTADAALEAIAYDWVSNNADWTATHAPAVANAWEWGVENTLTFADKDGDVSVYYVTISKAVPSSDATLSALSYGTPATAIALSDGVYTYDVELPYGTSDVPALAATKNHVGATIVSISDAAAFVDRKATSTVTVKAEDATTIQVYTVNFAVSRYESKLLWDGSTMTQMSDITAAATAAGVSVTTTGISVTSFSAKTCEENGKSYTKALDFGGKTQSTRYFGIEIPAGKVAKVSLVYRAKGTSRFIMVATALSSAIDESTITSKDAVDGSNLYVMKADMFGGGTLYINTTDGFHVHEISIQLADGYARSAMLGNGVLGTVCVDHNVAVEDIQGVTVYELVGREPQYGKVAFDEIISGELEAGAPYVFQAHGNHMALLYGETSVSEPVDKDNGMYGTFVDQTLTELNDIYYFAQRALWSCVDLSNLSVPANRAYVKLSEIDYISDPNPAPGRRRVMMSVNGKNTPTALDEIRQEQSANSQKLLINGQLFILRGEKVFDATGRLVK